MNERSQSILLAVAIVVAGAGIAGFIIVAGAAAEGEDANQQAVIGEPGQGQLPVRRNLDMRPVTESSFVYGDRSASVTFFAYSDYRCPFCAQMHPRLERLADEHDDVQLVYRHLPLKSSQNRAAKAGECIGHHAGDSAFYAFTRTAFSKSASLGDELYRSQAKVHGVSTDDLAQCMRADKTASAIETDSSEARAAGARGTPFIVVRTNSGQYMPFMGARSYERLSNIVQMARQL
jgi:protein-disulfide isomerase